MSKKVRKIQWNSPEVTTKRKCVDRKPNSLQTENLFDAEDEELSFFTVSKLNTIPNGKFNDRNIVDFGNLENDNTLFRSQIDVDVVNVNNKETDRSISQQNIDTHFNSFDENTFLTKSLLDNVMAECKEATPLTVLVENEPAADFTHDKSCLTVTALDNLLNDTPLELFSSPNKMCNSDKTELRSNALLKIENTNNSFEQNNVDDSIFNTINLHSGQNDASQKQLKIDDTIFANINIEDITKDDEKDDLTIEIISNDIGLQSSQRFLDDVAVFKVPQAPPPPLPALIKSPATKQTDNFPCGTQYAIHSNLANTTILSNLSRLDWDSQVFADKLKNDFPSKGEFFGLPDKVKKMIFEHKGIKNLYEWQEECLNLPAIRMRKNLIYALPTSGGKTLVAEILMLREVLCREKDVLFILPYVSIVQEKVSAMAPFAIAMNFIVDEYTAGKGKCPPVKRKKRKSIFIASIEKGAVLIDSLIETQRADEIGLVVVDELHLIGEKGRGATLEALLTKIMFIDVNIQIVGMSATIGNLPEVSNFLKADVYTRSFRPVELREYIKCGNDILEINTEGKTLEEVFVYSRNVDFQYNEAITRCDPDHLAGLVAECAPEHCVLVFCPSRKNCENVALLLSQILPKKFKEHRKREKDDLMDALDKVCGVLGDVLAKTIPYGIAYHHSGLTIDERKFIETAYRYGVISVICCTSTLAAGVNLPAKRVIIRAPYVGSEFMTLCRYKQMVGRAGRAGMGEAGESFLITTSRDNVRVGEMLFSPMDKAMSSLDYEDCIGLQYNEAITRCDPDHLAGLVAECAPEHCVLVFCPSRKNCENVALLLSQILPKKFKEHRKREKDDLMDALDKVCGVLGDVLAKTIPYGIAYHHSGLTIDERKFIETAYRYGVISVICCTSTLAAGVNLPAKRVIIRAPYVGSEFMTLCRYKQMVGRAGRAGMGEAGESFLITTSRDNVRVGEMLFSPMDKAMSSLDYEDCIGLQSLILSAIGLEIATCRSDLYRLVASTLIAVQAPELQLSTEQMVLKLIREMFKHKVLELCSSSSAATPNISNILTTQDVKNKTASTTSSQERRRLFISKSTRFQLTNIGRAAFKAGIDYNRTYAIYNELKFAQKHLILTNYAHLLYLVVSFNSNAKGDELFAADASILYRSYISLDATMQDLFKLLGFTEASAVKMAKTLSVQGPLELKLNRLYKALILIDILNVKPLPSLAKQYKVERGTLQTLINQSIVAASAIVRLCEQLEEFWCYKSLFERIGSKLDRCGTMELEALLDLPAVKINRAKQLYSAGFKTIEDIAKCQPIHLVRSVEHMPMKIAKEIISAAKIILMKKLDYLEEEAEALKLCLK